MLWYVMVWYDMMWYDMMWCRMVRCGLVWHGLVCMYIGNYVNCMVWSGMEWFGMYIGMLWYWYGIAG